MTIFISEWRKWWRFWSVRLNLIGVTIMSALLTWPDIMLMLWNQMPYEVKTILPPRITMVIPLAIFAAATFARIVKQKKLEDAKAHK